MSAEIIKFGKPKAVKVRRPRGKSSTDVLLPNRRIAELNAHRAELVRDIEAVTRVLAILDRGAASQGNNG
jgi:hypothetical protein